MNPSLYAPRLISPKRAAEKTSLTTTTLRRLVQAKEFPQPIRLTTNRIAFAEPAVDAWIALKMGVAA